MTAAAIQLVRPVGARHEGVAVGLVTVLLLAAVALYINNRGDEAGYEKLYDWQVSAFHALKGPDQAIYNALYTIKDEIPYLYDDINMFNKPGEKFRWPNIKDFEEALMPPFLHDHSWEQNGSLQWSLHEPLAEGEMQGSTMYLGTDGRAPNQGSFLLVIGHVHAGFQTNNAIVIWWSSKNHVAMPQSGFRDSLILQGWREVVALSGADEVKRIYGDSPDSKKPNSDDQKAADQIEKDLLGN
jgi:hypothetical protein